MGFLKSVKTLGTLNGMKKIGKEVGKIIEYPSRKVHVKHSLASAKYVDYTYYDDTEDLMIPLLSSNEKGEYSDTESSSTIRNTPKTSISTINDETRKPSEPESNSSSTSTRDPSTTFMCDMCVKPTHLKDSFDIEGCSHFYCQQCIVDFVRSKLEDNVTFVVCPEAAAGCGGWLEPKYCRPILPDGIFDRWIGALHDHNEQPSNAETYCGTSPGYFTCNLCAEQVHLEDSFDIKGCNHFYCQRCVVKFIVSKLEDNVTSIMCPEAGCSGVLDPEYCHPILPNDIYDRWGKALCENVIMGSESSTNYFYCPFADCSALLIRDDEINMSVCPHCKREVCAKCKVPWHIEFSCNEFERLRDRGED